MSLPWEELTFLLQLATDFTVSADGRSLIVRHRDKSDLADNFLDVVRLPKLSAIREALDMLRDGCYDVTWLHKSLSRSDGREIAEIFGQAICLIDSAGGLIFKIPGLATAYPMQQGFPINLCLPFSSSTRFRLSRFAYQRRYGKSWVLESPLSRFRIAIESWQCFAMLAKTCSYINLGELSSSFCADQQQVWGFFYLLAATGFLDLEDEPPSHTLWEFHNLLFHARSRLGRHDLLITDISSGLKYWSAYPVSKCVAALERIVLPKPDMNKLAKADISLTQAIESRQSIRSYDEDNPISLGELGEFLYRTSRIRNLYSLNEEDLVNIRKHYGPDFDWGDLSSRPYPSGGGMYELEIYVVVRTCQDLQPGVYHYDALGHTLSRLGVKAKDVGDLLTSASEATGFQAEPQVLFIVTARFGRLFRKYRSIAYSLILQHVGILYQNFYLVATSMGLAPCALGSGNSDLFARACGIEYLEESSVGEFMLGSCKSSNLERPESHNSLSLSTASSGLKPQDKPQSGENKTAVRSPISTNSRTNIHTSTKIDSTHYLDDQIPGLRELRSMTLGDQRIRIVILDGDPDISNKFFLGAKISKRYPDWHPMPERLPSNAYNDFRAISNMVHLTKEQRRELLEATFTREQLFRIYTDNHATHISSIIVGQIGSACPGISPLCEVINIPLNSLGCEDEFISTLNLSRAFDLALDVGASIIHCGVCRPTKTGEVDPLLLQAIMKCRNNKVLVIAPTGNNGGSFFCLPAGIDGVLSVGALKPNGKPYPFSNWSSNSGQQGIMAPGGDIIGAQPSSDQPIRLTGTSMAAPIVSGICGLLMSIQLLRTNSVDSELIRQCLIENTDSCVYDDGVDPRQCMMGQINLIRTVKALQRYMSSGAGSKDNKVDSPIGYFHGYRPPFELSVDSEPDSSLNWSHLVSSKSSSIETEAEVFEQIRARGHVYVLGSLSWEYQKIEVTGTSAMLKVQEPFLDCGATRHLEILPKDELGVPDPVLGDPKWIVSINGKPVYSLVPNGAFANDTDAVLRSLISNDRHQENCPSQDVIVGVSGKLVGKTDRLLSGEEVQIIAMAESRSVFGWTLSSLMEDSIAAVKEENEVSESVSSALGDFLRYVYFSKANLGISSRDRAFNYAVTNLFQITKIFSHCVLLGLEFREIRTCKSPYCRLRADCWDIWLIFSDPGNPLRSKRVFCFTIDSSDALPVTVGEVRSWSVTS